MCVAFNFRPFRTGSDGTEFRAIRTQSKLCITLANKYSLGSITHAEASPTVGGPRIVDRNSCLDRSIFLVYEGFDASGGRGMVYSASCQGARRIVFYRS